MPSPGYIPGPLVIPATFAIRLLWILSNGKATTNVLHAIVPDGLTNNQTLADTLYNSIASDAGTATYFAFLAPTTALQAVDVRDLRVASQGVFQSAAGATPGTGVGNPLPQEVSLVVSLRSELAGVAHRGRAYLTGFDESVLDAAGHAVGGLTAAARNWMQVVSDVMAASNMSLGIAHRGHAEYTNHLGHVVPAEAAGTDRVVSIVVRDNVFDSQRRRK